MAQNAIGATRFREVLIRDVLAVERGERVLDIGCGPADILADLPEVDYVGVDHSERYIADAKLRFNSAGTFLVATADQSSLPTISPRSLAIAVGVLHHLNDDEATSALNLAYSALEPGGRMITADPTFAVGQHFIGRALARRDRGRFVRTPDETLTIAQRVFPSATISVRHDLLRVPYSHVIVTGNRPY